MRLPVRVLRKQFEARDICSFLLAHAHGEALPPASAGAHVSIELPGGLTRQYSLCNAQGENGVYRVCVLRTPDSRGGSRYLHEQVTEGDVLHIGLPVNLFPLVDHSGPAVLMAGGIGVTPLFAMAQELHGLGRGFQLHYFARSPERTAFHQELLDSAYAQQVRFHLGEVVASQQVEMVEILRRHAADAHLYVCGPTPFIDFVLASARQNGWPADRLHWEHFAAVAPGGQGDTAFEVEIASTGQVMRVAPDQTVVHCLAQHGIHIPVSCEQGICGTCLTRVKAGVVDHRDAYLSDEERAAHREMLPCCSRAQSTRLILDL